MSDDCHSGVFGTKNHRNTISGYNTPTPWKVWLAHSKWYEMEGVSVFKVSKVHAESLSLDTNSGDRGPDDTNELPGQEEVPVEVVAVEVVAVAGALEVQDPLTGSQEYPVTHTSQRQCE